MVGIIALWYFRLTLGTRKLVPVLHPGTCQSCHYSLHGLARSGACPECSHHYDVDAPLKWRHEWNVGKDAYRTFFRTSVFVFCSLLLTFLQFPYTYVILRLSNWKSDVAYRYASVQTEGGSNAIVALWPVIAAIVLAPLMRVARWNQYWRVLATCVLVPPCLLFVIGFHKSHWSAGIFGGFVHGSLTGPAFWSTFLVTGLVCIRQMPRWSRRLYRRIGLNEHEPDSGSVQVGPLESTHSGDAPADTNTR